MNYREENLSRQRSIIERLDLPPACKAVMRAIHDYGRGSWAWPSRDTLAIEAGLSKRRVAAAIKRLESLNLLIVDKRKLHGKTGYLYLILWQKRGAK